MKQLWPIVISTFVFDWSVSLILSSLNFTFWFVLLQLLCLLRLLLRLPLLLKMVRVGTKLEDCFVLETASFDDMFAISEKLDVNRSVMCGGYDLVLRWIYGCSLCLRSFVYFFFTSRYCFFCLFGFFPRGTFLFYRTRGTFLILCCK